MKYKFLSNVKLNGIFYEAGQEIDLPEVEETEKLVIDGLLEALEEVEPVVEEKPKTRRKRK